MAAPLSADRVLAALRAEGLRVVELPGWRTHNRNTVGAWGPVHGVMLHYTAAHPGSLAKEHGYAHSILRNGYAGLPGPLSQFGVGTDGTVYLCGWGRANHAGKIDVNQLHDVMAGALSLDATEYPDWTDDVDGNARMYGIEMITAGRATPAQLAASRGICAAVCRAHGWSGRDVISHGEATRRKTNDPPGINMGHFRREVMAQVARPINPPKPPSPAPPQEAPVIPEVIEHWLTVEHDGKGWNLIRPELFKPRARPTRYTTTSHVLGPEGSQLVTRVVAWHGAEWFRYPATAHALNSGIEALSVFTHAPHIPVHLDVHSFVKGPLTIHSSTLLWEV